MTTLTPKPQMKTLFTLAMTAAFCAAAVAQEPILITETPSPDALGYLGDYGHAVAGLGDDLNSGNADLLIGQHKPFNQAVFVRDGRTGAVLAEITSLHPMSIGNFGYAVDAVSDVSGDGRDDILIGAFSELAPGGGANGRVYLYSRPQVGGQPQLLREFTPASGSNIWEFGRDVAGIQDVDGDGFGDVLIGQFGHEYSSIKYPGHAYLYSGATGTLLQTLSYPGTINSKMGFGEHVAAVPDADGDGLDDIAVSADTVQAQQNVNESVYVFSSATGQLIREIQPPSNFPYRAFGSSIAGIEDLNGDGLGELVVGERGGAGRVYVYSVTDGALLATLTSILPDGVSGKGFGESVDASGDVTGDGIPDIIVGAPGEVYGGKAKGRAYAFSGADFSLLSVMQIPKGYAPGFDWDFAMGTAVAIMPDANGDGRAEYLVGAPKMTVPDSPWGATFTFFCPSEVEALATVRLGTPANPQALNALGAPVIGSDWQVQIDHSTFVPGALADVVLVSPNAVNLPSPNGTLLVDSNQLLYLRAGAPGGVFTFPIPANCAFVGATLSVQGASFDGASFFGANALDVVVGTQ